MPLKIVPRATLGTRAVGFPTPGLRLCYLLRMFFTRGGPKSRISRPNSYAFFL